MTTNRRAFLKGSGLLAAAAALRSAKAAGESTPAAYSASVVVVGGGPSGVCAAIAAARNGADVLVLEQGNCLGGMGTRGLVGPFMTCYDKTGETMVVRGLFEEIVDRLVSCGGAVHPKDVHGGTSFTAWITRGHDHCTPFDPEALKFVLDDLCAEAGVKVLYHADFVKPVMEGDRITGVEILTKKGIERVAAQIVIDATKLVATLKSQKAFLG